MTEDTCVECQSPEAALQLAAFMEQYAQQEVRRQLTVVIDAAIALTMYREGTDHYNAAEAVINKFKGKSNGLFN